MAHAGLLRICSCLADVYIVMDAHGKFGEPEDLRDLCFLL